MTQFGKKCNIWWHPYNALPCSVNPHFISSKSFDSIVRLVLEAGQLKRLSSYQTLPFSHPLLSIHLLRYLRTLKMPCCTDNKHNSLSPVLSCARSLRQYILPTHQASLAIVQFWCGGIKAWLDVSYYNKPIRYTGFYCRLEGLAGKLCNIARTWMPPPPSALPNLPTYPSHPRPAEFIEKIAPPLKWILGSN